MFRKIVIGILMLLYLYTLLFDIFLNNYFTKIPAPILLGLPLVLLFTDKQAKAHQPQRETFFFLLAGFAYYVIAQSDFKAFAVNSIVFIVAVLYFSYFVKNSLKRFKASILIVYVLLVISTLIMFADHFHTTQIDVWRGRLIGAEVNQSPSGLCTSIFTFGYQLATLLGFALIYMVLTRRHFLIVLLVLAGSMIAAYYGMQRSAFIAFVITIVFFCIVYYGYRAIPVLSGIALFSALFFMLILKPYYSSGDNIFNKNATNASNGENRSGLVLENLKIYSSYPFGLIFYGKQWKDVSKRTPAFSDGLTSHNAYLMFITYLGPFAGVALLVLIYYRTIGIFKRAFLNIKDRRFALLASLCFSLIAVSLNSLFHNAWLGNANGPTVFLFLAILHYDRLLIPEVELATTVQNVATDLITV